MNIGFFTLRQSEISKQLNIFQKFLEEKLPQSQFQCFDSGEKFQEFAVKEAWDVIYCDTAGVETEAAKNNLREFRSMFPQTVIVIIAENEQFAVFGYSVCAFDYIQDLTDERKLIDSMERILKERFGEMINSFFVRIKSAWTKLDIRHICYLETFNHHIIFYMDDGKEFKRKGSFKDLHTELICNPLLFQCHKSYVVNGLFVESMTQGSFLMKDGKKISISRPYRKASRKFFAQNVSRQCS